MMNTDLSVVIMRKKSDQGWFWEVTQCQAPRGSFFIKMASLCWDEGTSAVRPWGAGALCENEMLTQRDPVFAWPFKCQKKE